MKFIINQSSQYTETEIIVNCGVVDERLEKLIMLIRLHSFSVMAKKDNQSFAVRLEEIFYFETVDDKTFIYLSDDVFETDLKLYELENQLSDSRFVRISKSSILNIEQLKSVKALLNGKYEATLKNDEKILISRHYVPGFKEKFGLGGSN